MEVALGALSNTRSNKGDEGRGVCSSVVLYPGDLHQATQHWDVAFDKR